MKLNQTLLLLLACSMIALTITPVIAQDDIDPYTPITKNAEWTPVEYDFDDITMVLVPVGCFMMGNPKMHDLQEHCIEQPFWITKTEITNVQFLPFLEESENQNEDGVVYYDTEAEFARITQNVEGEFVVSGQYMNHPVSSVTWYGAQAFCESINGRLLTESEWEFANRGPDNLIYSWGDEWNARNLIWTHTKPDDTLTAEVGTIPQGVSWVGTLDMSGNVFEWLDTPEIAYPYPAEDAEIVDDGKRVKRGGSYWSSKGAFSFTPGSDGERQSLEPEYLLADTGIRCARDFDSIPDEE